MKHAVDVANRSRSACECWLILLALLAIGTIARAQGDAPSSPTLHVAGVAPVLGQAFDREITFFFNADLSRESAALERPIHFEPAMEGRFFTGPRYIQFIANKSQKGQTVRATLDASLRSADGRALAADSRSFSFYDEFAPMAVWKHEADARQLILRVRYPGAVKADEAAAMLSISDRERRPVKFERVPTDEADRIALAVPADAAAPLTLRFAYGLWDAKHERVQRETKKLVYPQNQTLSVRALWSEYTAETQRIALQFNDGVDPSQIKPNVTLTDVPSGQPLNYQVTTDEARSRLELELDALPDAANAQIRVEVKADLVSQGDRLLPQPYSVTLLHRAAPLQITYASWQTWGGSMDDPLFYQINTTHALEPKQLEQYAEFEPPIENARFERQWDRSYRLSGEFRSSQLYTMRLKAGMPLGDGSTLKQPFTHTFQAPRVPVKIEFDAPGQYYLPRQASMQARFRARNAAKVKLTAYKVFPNNIALAVKEVNDGKGGWQFESSWCLQAAEQEIELNGPADAITNGSFDLAALLGEDINGVFALQLVAHDADGQASDMDRKIALLTRIGAMAHWQADELALFAHDLYTLEPLGGANVRVYSDKNQLLGEGKADRQGLILLRGFDTSLGQPVVAAIERKDDFTFLELKSRTEDYAAAKIAGAPYPGDKYEAFFYGERDLYRPGETARICGIVRERHGDAVAAVPLLLETLKPDGKPLFTRTVTPDEFGAFTIDAPTQRSHPTGRYTIQLKVPGEDEPIGSYAFQLEEFVPLRMEAKVSADSSLWRAADTVKIEVTGRHLFGAPAADRQASAQVRFEPLDWKPDGWEGFGFGLRDGYKPNLVSLGEQITDAEGRTVFEYAPRPGGNVPSPLRITIIGAVHEIGGRAASARASAVYFPAGIMLGLQITRSETDPRAVDVQVAAVQPDGAPADLAQATLMLQRKVYGNGYFRRYYSHYGWEWETRYETAQQVDVDLKDGHGAVTLSLPSSYGDFRLNASAGDGALACERDFYSGWNYLYTYGADTKTKPNLLKVTLDRDEYEPGDVAEIQLEAPFDGHGVIVVQGERFEKMIPVDVKDNRGVARLKVEPGFFPNVWLQATVAHSTDNGAKEVMPLSSFGAADLRVNEPKRRLNVELPGAPQELRPLQAVNFQLRVTDYRGKPVHGNVTLAAVDDGIHLLSGYQNPDPYAWLRRVRKPDLNYTYYYDRVAYEFDKPQTGGDGGEELSSEKRLSENASNWIKTVALWSGELTTDNNGEAEAHFTVPEFNGRLRIVAVACSEHALGAAADSVLIRRPYMLRTSLPRFLYPGDATECRAVLFNTTTQPVTAELRWQADGRLKRDAGKSHMELPANAESSNSAQIAAGDAPGSGMMKWNVSFSGADGEELEQYNEELKLPILTPAAYQAEHHVQVLKPGESYTFKAEGYLPDDRLELELSLGSSPLLYLRRSMKYLLSYPYGCVEQTTSRLMPLYVMSGQPEALDALLDETTDIERMIQGGIDRLFSMQTATGGLGSWAGDAYPYPYGSIYALNCLTLIRGDARFDVPEANFRDLQQYVRQIALDYNGADSDDQRYTRCYAIYTLALDGDGEALRTIERFDNIDLPEAGRYLLAAALAVGTKDPARVRQYLNETPSHPYNEPYAYGALNSELRNKAVRLMALTAMQDTEAECEKLAYELADALTQDDARWNTHQRALALSAWALYYKRMHAAESGETRAMIEAPDGEHTASGTETYHGKCAGSNKQFIVRNAGKTNLILNCTTRGVPLKPNLEAISEGLTVERRLLTTDGAAADQQQLHTGRTYVMELTLKTTLPRHNIIVSELLPAGLEVENPRLEMGGGGVLGFMSELRHPSFQDLRDDRLILAYNELPQGTSRFYYTVTAMAPGEYAHPGLEAECMYDARVRARSAAGKVMIQP